MKDLFFWLRWKSSYQALYLLLLILFLATIAGTGLAYLYGDVYTIGWDTTGEWKNIILGVDTFDVNQFSISQESQQYLLQQRYVPGDVKVHPWISYTYLAFIWMAFIIFLTVISYLNIWLYITGNALFLFFIMNMHTEQLGIFGMYNKVPAAFAIIAFSGLTYYFNAYGKHIGLFIRLAAITLSCLIFIACIQFGSRIEYPFLYTSNYAITIPIILSIVFMFVVGYDIIQALVLLTSYGRSDFKTSGNAIWNFIIIGGLYLANLFIVYFKPAFLADLNLVFLQPFIVLAISGLVGIWMFSEKKEVSAVIPFQPLGAILFLALGIITFSTIALGYITANDALITTLENAALYIQIGMGLAIFVYVLINFWSKYKKQEEVYKQFYIPYQVPFFVARSVGWVIAFYFFFSSNMFIYKSGLAAYYNHVGDIYLYTGQDHLATSHYESAYQWEFQNQRTCYTLGNFYQQRDNKEKAFTYYEACLNKKPSVYAYTALSTFYINNNQFFPSLFMLKDGLETYSDNPYLLNNMGYLYTRFSKSDSSAYFYSQALANAPDDLPAANLLAHYAQKGDFAQCDTIIKSQGKRTSLAYQANKIGVRTMSGLHAEETSIPLSITSDSVADAYSFTYLYNYTFNILGEKDSVLHLVLDRYIRHPENDFYKPNLMYAKAMQLYYSQSNVPAAFILLEELVHTESEPLYIITLSDWQLKAGLYQQAYETYLLLITYPDQRLVAYRCIAAYEAGLSSRVQETVQELTKSQIPQAAAIATTLMRTSTKSTDASLSDQEKVQGMHYRAASIPELQAVKQSIQDPIQSILLDIDLLHKLNEKQEHAKAMEVWNALEKPESIPAEVIAQANLEYLHILAGLAQWDLLKNELQATVLLKKDQGYIEYYTARALQHSADSAKTLSYFQKAVNKIGYVDWVQVEYANNLLAAQKEMEALEQLVEAKKVIQYSKPLSLSYIDICLRLGFFKAAEEELNNISSLLSTNEIEQIERRFYTGPLPE